MMSLWGNNLQNKTELELLLWGIPGLRYNNRHLDLFLERILKIFLISRLNRWKNPENHYFSVN